MSKGKGQKIILFKLFFFNYCLFTCLPIGTGRVVSVQLLGIDGLVVCFYYCLISYMSSHRHRKGRIGAITWY